MTFKEKFANIFLKPKSKKSGTFFVPDKDKNETKDERVLAYEKAKGQYIDNTVNQAKTLHTWKMAFFVTFIMMSISICYSFYLASRSTLIPYVIEVDETGNAKGINPAYQIAYNPEELSKEYFIRELIYKARTITLDNVTNGTFYKNNMLWAWQYKNKQLHNIYKIYQLWFYQKNS